MNAPRVALSPAAAGLCGLLEAASSDGHTVLPVAVAGSVLGGVQLRLENALREVGPAGSGLVSAPAPGLLGFRRTIEAEHAIAAAVHRLSTKRALFVVAGPAGEPRDAAVREIEASTATAAVADDAEYLDVETLAVFLAACDDEPVVLTGDLAGLGSPGTGRGFADIAESGFPVVTQVAADPATTGAALRRLANSIAAGELGEVTDPHHEAVLVTAVSTAEAAYRVTQLVNDSIPRVIGIDPSDVQVLTPLVAGGCGTAELALTLASSRCARPLLVHESLGRRWPAVVLVLPPEASGVLSRPLVYSAVTRATRHISIVNATGTTLRDAVRYVPSKRRRTLLATLLLAGAESPSADNGSADYRADNPMLERAPAG